MKLYMAKYRMRTHDWWDENTIYVAAATYGDAEDTVLEKAPMIHKDHPQPIISIECLQATLPTLASWGNTSSVKDGDES